MTISPSLDERFRAAAAAEGLLDVAFDVFDDTPIGPLLVGVTDRGVCRISFDAEPEHHLEVLARQFGPRVLRSSKPVERVHASSTSTSRAAAGTSTSSPTRGSCRSTTGSCSASSRASSTGRRRRTGRSPRRPGNPRAARAVGTVMNRNPIPIILPCHRVIGASGSLTGYGGGLDLKERLLRLEGAIL